MKISSTRRRVTTPSSGSLIHSGYSTWSAINSNRTGKWFRRVVGVDLSAEMVGYARQNAIDQKIKNVDFHVLSGDDISSVAGEFRLVSYGSALHWMDIPKRLPPAIRCSHRAVASPSWACAVSGAEDRTGNRPWSRSFGVGWGRTGGPARARSTRQFKKIFDLRMH
ncbi:MAG: class I SAM-dependent methyltransferase [Chloroflexi bacterium]|nr:class I SAM-dependent methyltransferase [Chloroflexota bacterium]MCI0880761.1 class I SAM-dependent methyltransferase [Chloroflexota bacterium]